MQESLNGSSSNTNGSTSGFCVKEAASQNMHDCSQAQMKSISLEEYRRIVNATVELYRANKTIKKLESLIQQRDEKITHLKAQLETAKRTITEDLSPVSLSNESIILHRRIQTQIQFEFSVVVSYIFYIRIITTIFFRNKMRY